MNYHIHYTYEGHFGRSESYAYKTKLSEARDDIDKHLADESEPKPTKWRLYELIEEGEKNDK